MPCDAHRSGYPASLANAITLVRLAIAPFCAWAVLAQAWWAAAALFALAVLSDLADGHVARRRSEVTAFGGLLDHGSDALFVSAALAALAWHGVIPPLLPVLVLAAFAQYMLDSRALEGRALRTSRLGRANGIAYFVLAGIAIGREALGLAWPGPGPLAMAAWLLVVTTLASMADRLRALFMIARH